MLSSTTPLPHVWYRLDADGRIVEVSPDWDQLADAYDAPSVRAAGVVGRRLSDFLAGDAARMFVDAAVQSVRVLGRPVTLPYRCDGQDQLRRFEMELQPTPDLGVVVHHRLVAIEARPTRPPRRPDTRGGWRCSQCLRVRFRGSTTWEEANVAFQFVALDVCPECSGRLFERLGLRTDRGSSDDEG